MKVLVGWVASGVVGVLGSVFAVPAYAVIAGMPAEQSWAVPLVHHQRGRVICSGVLVGPRQVLTAKHCVDSVQFAVPGAEVERVNTTSVVGDVACIRLKRALVGRDPIQIAASPPRVGDLVEVFGYGTDDSLSVARMRRNGTSADAQQQPALSLEVVSGVPAEGDSGAPVTFSGVTSSGRLVAVISGADAHGNIVATPVTPQLKNAC